VNEGDFQQVAGVGVRALRDFAIFAILGHGGRSFRTCNGL
jgi:hypothetical protein